MGVSGAGAGGVSLGSKRTGPDLIGQKKEAQAGLGRKKFGDNVG